MAFSSLSQCLKSHCQFDSDIVGPLLPVPRARARPSTGRKFNEWGPIIIFGYSGQREEREREREETIAVPLLIDVCI